MKKRARDLIRNLRQFFFKVKNTESNRYLISVKREGGQTLKKQDDLTS